ncbi:Protein of unknown function [Andreprevotia lacus DSM 23236]|uniref:Uncharacterized protein n=2 Tax=Andreprevotia TaxID=397275 RepID=A0A1W1XZ94_9NEIS|nr:Protein of unknown function [Andreprevotia lacus DSM 23236]
MFNQLWDGQNLTIDRRAEKQSFVVENPRVTLSLFLQRGPLERYFARRGDEARELGLLARCLICEPPSTQGWRAAQPQEWQHSHQGWLHERATQLLKQGIDKNGQPVTERQVLRFGVDAEIRYFQHLQQIKNELMPCGAFAQAKDLASKLDRQIARVAALLQLFETGGHEISLPILNASIEIVMWYANEYLRLFVPPPPVPQLNIDAEAVFLWMHGRALKNNNRYIIKNDVLKGVVPTKLRRAANLEPVLHLLASQQRIGYWHSGGLQYLDMSPQLVQDPFDWHLAVDSYRMRRKSKKSSMFVS